MASAVSYDVLEMVRARYGPVERVGAGAWSTAYRFSRDGRDMVLRVGKHVSDFVVDEEMARHRGPRLPIPEVIEVLQLDPPHDDHYACVSTFAEGVPLEEVESDEWEQLVPRVADLLEAMRAIDAPADSPAWPEVLFDAHDDDSRLDGWRTEMKTRPQQVAVHAEVIDQLRSLCEKPSVAGVRPTLLHCDLINRNVNVSDGTITGVFDWGCRRWGDHLYDLAWFEFWAPWHPTLDVGLLRAELVGRWGQPPDSDRINACLLHIGADHLVYNAAIGNLDGGDEVLSRMQALDLIND